MLRSAGVRAWVLQPLWAMLSISQRFMNIWLSVTISTLKRRWKAVMRPLKPEEVAALPLALAHSLCTLVAVVTLRPRLLRPL